MSYVSYYIEAYLACFLLLCIILYNIIKGVNKQASQIYLMNLIINLMLYFIAEIFWIVVDASVGETSFSLKVASNLFTYSMITVSAYCWFILSESFQKDENVEKAWFRRILAIPIFLPSF